MGAERLDKVNVKLLQANAVKKLPEAVRCATFSRAMKNLTFKFYKFENAGFAA